MQFFLPSLIALIIAMAIVFAVLPRLAGPILVTISMIILGFALYQHVALFKTEYASSTWQTQLKFYAPFVMVAGLLLAVLVYFGVLSGGRSASLPTPTFPSTPVLPPAATATNPITAALNTGIRTVTSPFVATTPQNQNRSFFSPV